MFFSNNSTSSRELDDISTIYINLSDVVYRTHAFLGITISAVTSTKANTIVTMKSKPESILIPINNRSLEIFRTLFFNLTITSSPEKEFLKIISFAL